ncbi:MAG: hypothetical protein DHS20C18_05810 [Saprospiraceae bacterium]|nr:MAG: hypothetical protein DHS20C18_05810 [Saprospiraceae bacterium]
MKNRLILLGLIGLLLSCEPASKQSPTEEEQTQSAISNESLLDSIQYRTFQYFWEGAEPTSGLARERFHVDGVYPQDDKNVITSGGSGFGIMAILVGMHRGFITQHEGYERLVKIVSWLEKADRFHGVWPHWIYGETGKTKPFSKKDDGGDLVETSFLIQGLLSARQYFYKGGEKEKALGDRIDQLWREVEWSWHQGPDQENIVFWHWSPNFGWDMNFRINGYNECLITYVLAASSPTYPIPAAAYHEGWAQNGNITGGPTKYGYHLDFKHIGAPEYGGPLFWSHYSFLGLDPRQLKDKYADYWEHNKNHVLIDQKYCIENPHGYKGYGADCWGLTSSYSLKGYSSHKPEKDLGVIAPTAALSSFPYAPEQCMEVARHFYTDMADQLWGPYGFYDAFSEQENWFPKKYLAIDQGPIVVMIENYRSGLLWDLFMSCPEVQDGLTKLGFTY